MSLMHNFLIIHPILLKPFLIGLSDFSPSSESKLFFGVDLPKLVLIEAEKSEEQVTETRKEETREQGDKASERKRG